MKNKAHICEISTCLSKQKSRKNRKRKYNSSLKGVRKMESHLPNAFLFIKCMLPYIFLSMYFHVFTLVSTYCNCFLFLHTSVSQQRCVFLFGQIADKSCYSCGCRSPPCSPFSQIFEKGGRAMFYKNEDYIARTEIIDGQEKYFIKFLGQVNG